MRFEISDELNRWLVATRRRFHRIPEPGYKEQKTAAAICGILDELNLPYQREIGITCVVAHLRGARPGPAVAFRADMDGLPIEENSDLPFQSEHAGFMHACGHDGHVAIGLGILRLLCEEKWSKQGSGEIVCIFQPAEEGGAGAKAMLDTGIFDDTPIGAAFSVHMEPSLPAGHIGLIPGPAHAATDEIAIRITGKGGHGAHPDQCRDPIVAAAHLITQLQTVVSRTIDPLEGAALTIGQIHGGSAHNVIPETVFMQGTLRTLSPAVRETAVARIEHVVHGNAAAFGVSADLECIPGYPVMVNYPGPLYLARHCATNQLGTDRVHTLRPSMGGEDFAYFADRWKGMQLQLGCHDPGQGFTHGLHSPHFVMDERALATGVGLMAHILTEYLAGGMPDE